MGASGARGTPARGLSDRAGMAGFPFKALGRPLSAERRRRLRRELLQLLSWQRNLGRFPRAPSAPDGTPIVSLYADGRLVGCTGWAEDSPGERLLRAFVQAVGDPRFGGIPAGARATLVAQVAYPIRPRAVALEDVVGELSPGTDGLALVLEDGRAFTLSPDVARDEGLVAEGLLQALEQKSGTGRQSFPQRGLFLYETERVVARLGDARRASRDPQNPVASAVAWLAARVGSNGAVRFGLDPKDGTEPDQGLMLHGRAAVVLRALSAHPGGARAKKRAERWLRREIERALAGKAVPGWPDDVPQVAGTLALAAHAGLDTGRALAEMARRPELLENAWHAAQVVSVLGRRAPEELWQACVRDLERVPWAPWTALAALGRGDAAVRARAVRALIEAVPKAGPHPGGVKLGAVPELAASAIVVEVLAGERSPAARAACERARDFLLRQRFGADDCPAARAESWVRGAFPVTPVHAFLRSDVTAHALLALAPQREAKLGNQR